MAKGEGVHLQSKKIIANLYKLMHIYKLLQKKRGGFNAVWICPKKSSFLALPGVPYVANTRERRKRNRNPDMSDFEEA